MTRPRTINGDAYTSPSSVFVQARCGESRVGVAGSAPVRSALRWYWGQSETARGVGLTTAVGDPGRDGDGDRGAEPDDAGAQPAKRRTEAPMQAPRRLRAPRSTSAPA